MVADNIAIMLKEPTEDPTDEDMEAVCCFADNEPYVGPSLTAYSASDILEAVSEELAADPCFAAPRKRH